MKKGGDLLRFIKTIYFLIKRVPSVVFLGSWLLAGAVVFFHALLAPPERLFPE